MLGTTALPTHAAALNDDAPASKILASRHPALLPLRAGRVLVHRGVELEGGGAAVPG